MHFTSKIVVGLLGVTGVFIGCSGTVNTDTSSVEEPQGIRGAFAKEGYTTPYIESVIFGFEEDSKQIKKVLRKIALPGGAEMKVMPGAESQVLDVVAPPGTWAGVDFQPLKKGTTWDLSKYRYAVATITNTDSKPITFQMRVDNVGALDWANSVDGVVVVYPGETKPLVARFARPNDERLEKYVRKYLPRMHNLPGGYMHFWRYLDPANITAIKIGVLDADIKETYKFQIDNVRGAVGYYFPTEEELASGNLYPLVDKFGQYTRAEWPGKIKTVDALREQAVIETKDLKENSVATEWSTYGGWKSGPQLKATGHFRVEKHNEKWWYVDPEGYLFWSHGVTCVGIFGATTPIDGEVRKKFFEELPKEGDELSQFVIKRQKTELAAAGEDYNIGGANLYRKYGKNWKAIADSITHVRMRSWGLNTMAMWSDPDMYLQKKTPYTVAIHPNYESLSLKLPDPFYSTFEQNVREAMDYGKESFKDPWCIGIMVMNEIRWANDIVMGEKIMGAPASQPAKIAYVTWAKQRYGTIEKVNTAWNMQYSTFEEIVVSQKLPKIIPSKLEEDFKLFSVVYGEEYFRKIAKVIKEVAPNKLYMGCRFHHQNNRGVLLAATKYNDVVSYNGYKNTQSYVKAPHGQDKPIVIGEFHFRNRSRNLLAEDLREIYDEDYMGRAYQHYVRSSLENPNIVGTHWFQWASQVASGRGDGENYEIGLIDVVDQPYYNFIKYVRETGKDMYPRRMNSPNKLSQ